LELNPFIEVYINVRIIPSKPPILSPVTTPHTTVITLGEFQRSFNALAPITLNNAEDFLNELKNDH
jgi:hypothetical protein